MNSNFGDLGEWAYLRSLLSPAAFIFIARRIIMHLFSFYTYGAVLIYANFHFSLSPIMPIFIPRLLLLRLFSYFSAHSPTGLIVQV
jgi:hypothetical protein